MSKDIIIYPSGDTANSNPFIRFSGGSDMNYIMEITDDGYIDLSVEENIVTSGLTLYLDAGNYDSYSGGTTWYDLSGFDNNGTLNNGPIYNDGKIIFDGNNDYVSINHNTTNPNSTNIRGSLSVGMFCKSDHTLSTGWNTYWAGVSKYSQFILGPNGIGGKMAFLIHSGTWYPTGYGGAVWGQTNIDVRDYHYYVGTYNQDTGILSLYVDGILEVSFNIGVKTLSDDPNEFVINKRDVSGNYLKSTNLVVHIYNRALSATEVLQNFNAIKHRVGL